MDLAIYSLIKSTGQTPPAASFSLTTSTKTNFFKHVFRQLSMIKLLDLVCSILVKLKLSSHAFFSLRQKGINLIKLLYKKEYYATN